MKVENISDDTVGFRGIAFPIAPGQVVEVDEVTGAEMVEKRPAMFKAVITRPPAAQTRAEAGGTSPSSEPPQHRHRYRKSGTCRCGAMRPE